MEALEIVLLLALTASIWVNVYLYRRLMETRRRIAEATLKMKKFVTIAIVSGIAHFVFKKIMLDKGPKNSA